MIYKHKKSKKAVSSMVGYVLLITFGIILSVIAFNYLKTYIPRAMPECPDATSIFIKDYSCNMTTGQLNITLKNNGRFNYAGYYAHAARFANESIARINLVKNFTNSTDKEAVVQANTYILFSAGNANKMKPGAETTQMFNISTPIERIEITPLRFQQEGKSFRIVSCGKSKTKEEVICT